MPDAFVGLKEPVSLSEDLRFELEEGELLLWDNNPNPVSASIHSSPQAIFGLVWMSGIINFTIDWFPNGPVGIFGNHGFIHILFFVPFYLIGIGATFAPLFAWYIATKTIYAITDRRLIILKRFWWIKKVSSFKSEDFGEINRTERRDGSGTIRFHKRSDSDTVTCAVLHGIPDVKKVDALMRSIRDRNLEFAD